MKNKRDYSLQQSDLSRLKVAGYRVKIFSDVHWRVTRPDHHGFVDVWPTSGKYMEDTGSGAKFYSNIVSDVQPYFTPLETEQQKELRLELEEMRARGLDYFRNKL